MALGEGKVVSVTQDEEIQRLTAERDEARAWVRRLTAIERVLTCVYCGEAYPPGAPDHGAEVLTAHVRTCAKHPLRAAEAEIERLLGIVAELRASLPSPGVPVGQTEDLHNDVDPRAESPTTAPWCGS